MSKRLFADISSNNGPMNLHEYARAGHRLIAIKATEGSTYINPGHSVQAAGAHRLGLVVAHYHFCRPGDGTARHLEATMFWDRVAATYHPGDILVLDVEDRGMLSWPNLVNYVKYIANVVESRGGGRPYVYASLSWLVRTPAPPIEVPSRRFWTAAYGGHVPRLGFHRHRWAHQFTDGRIGRPVDFAGIGRCDASRLTAYGSADLAMRRRRRRRAGLEVAR